MGFLSKIFGGSANKSKPADNFEYIAMNITYIYNLLKNKFADRFSDEDSLLLASGIIDTLVYIQEGSISIEDIKNGLVAAKIGKCRIGHILVSHEEDVKTFFTGPKDTLLNFTMQIECMIFAVDEQSMSEKRIISTVITKKDDISKIIKNTQSAADSGKYPQGLEQLIEGFINSDKFSNIRKIIGIS